MMGTLGETTDDQPSSQQQRLDDMGLNAPIKQDPNDGRTPANTRQLAAGESGKAAKAASKQQDFRIIRQIQTNPSANHEALFKFLCDKHRPGLTMFCYDRLGNFEEAQDAVQETFVKMTQSIDRFEWRSSFSTWLYKIAANTVIDIVRKRPDVRIVPIDPDPRLDDKGLEDDRTSLLEDLGPSPDEIVEKNEKALMLHLALKQLPKHYRILLSLRYLKPVPVKEIELHARFELIQPMLQPNYSIANLLNRALKALGKIYSPYYFGDGDIALPEHER
jgi:RNA polymerase sigma-70 factor (ECF subfamily)